ncbi:hypothetical protein D3C87_1893630 [compost metagenome]|jgi:hypothetical protein|nr:hypothetical protein C8N37_10518 [Sphingobacterium faecium]
MFNPAYHKKSKHPEMLATRIALIFHPSKQYLKEYYGTSFQLERSPLLKKHILIFMHHQLCSHIAYNFSKRCAMVTLFFMDYLRCMFKEVLSSHGAEN